MLSADILRLSFDGARDILAAIQLECRRGAVTHIVGANGSGKTSLLLCCLGVYPYLRPAFLKGNVYFASNDKRDLLSEESLPRLHRITAYAGQNPDTCILAPTVVEELAMLAVIRGESWQVAESRATQIAESAGIGHLLSRRITDLSQGEKQLVVALGASAAHAQLVMLDEPFAMLDEHSRRALSEAIQLLLEEGCAVVLTSLPRTGQLANALESAIEPGADIGLLGATELPSTLPTEPRLSLQMQSLGESPVLRFDSVEHWYSDGWRLRSISGSITGGEVLWVLGNNGAGKSTLLRLLAGLGKPKRGQIGLSGKPVTARGLRPVKIAYVPQNPEHVIVGRTTREELVMNYVTAGCSRARIEEVVATWRQFSRVPESLEADPRSLSFGEKKFLSVLSCNLFASMVVFDEPYVGLDTPRRTCVARLIRALADSGRIVVASGHGMPTEVLKARVIDVSK